MKLRFPKLAAAVARYDETAARRWKMCQEARTDEDMERWAASDREAIGRVREAFIADHLNSAENSRLLGIETARQWAKLTLR